MHCVWEIRLDNNIWLKMSIKLDLTDADEYIHRQVYKYIFNTMKPEHCFNTHAVKTGKYVICHKAAPKLLSIWAPD